MSMYERFLDCVAALREQGVRPKCMLMSQATFERLDAELDCVISKSRVRRRALKDGVIVGQLDGVEIKVVF